VLLLAVATAFRLWDKAQAGALVEPSAHQIVPVLQKVLDGQTGAVTETPEPKRQKRTPLASRMEEVYTPPAKPTLASWRHEQLAGQGPLRWRRQLRRKNRDKVIVFVGHHYGICYASEILVLSGVPVRELPPHLGSRLDILRRYGCVPDA